MLKKSKVTGKYYNVETLTLEDKVRLGFDSEVVEELKSIPEQKKSLVIEQKEPKKRKKKDE